MPPPTKDKPNKDKSSKSLRYRSKSTAETNEPKLEEPAPQRENELGELVQCLPHRQQFQVSFGENKEEKGTKSGNGEKVDESRSLETVIRALELKMLQMVTPEYIEKEFRKIITEDLTNKLVKLREDLKNHFQEELAKVDHRVAELENKIKIMKRQ